MRVDQATILRFRGRRRRCPPTRGNRPCPSRTASPTCSASSIPSCRRRWAGSRGRRWRRPYRMRAAWASSRPLRGNSTRSRARSPRCARSRTSPSVVNIAKAFVRDPGIVDFVVDQGVKFVTTSAGDPTKYCGPLKAAGLTVFHVVPTLKSALKAIEAGVDGLVVEGGEGGGFKNPQPVMTMVLPSTGRGKDRRADHRRGRDHLRAHDGRQPSHSAPKACRWARAW